MLRVVVLLVALAATGLPGVARARSCTPVNGHSLTTIVPCGAPLCTEGRVWGGLRGTLSVVADSVMPAHPTLPSVLRFTGQSTIVAGDGSRLVGTDVGAIDAEPTGDGHVGTLLTWTGGTGRYAGATGHVVINGHVIGGQVTTDYRGEVCTD